MYRLYDCDPDVGPPNLTDWLQHVHPADRTVCRQKFEHAVGEGSPFVLDVRVLSPLGVSLWTRISGKPATQAGNRQSKLVGTVMDISSHKAAFDLIHDYQMLFETKVVQQLRNESEVPFGLDSFTGVSRRHVLVEVLEKEISRALRSTASLSLVLVMVEAVVEEESHDSVQHSLRQLAGALQVQARASDIVAR